MRWFSVAALGLALAACSKSPPSPNAGIDDVNSRLSSAGFKPANMVPADPSACAAMKCLEGTINGVGALECEYRDPMSAQASVRRCEAWVGAAVTGVALEQGKVVLVLADRSHADPNGKVMSKISKAFLGK